MSQEKVDRYKQQKANRKKIMKKEKRNAFLAKVATSVICLGIVGWAGYSVYNNVTSNQEAVQTDVNLDAINDYLSTLS